MVNATPRPLYARERPGTHCIAGWVEPRGRSGRARKISPPTGIRSPDRPARSESIYRLSYPGPRGWRENRLKIMSRYFPGLIPGPARYGAGLPTIPPRNSFKLFLSSEVKVYHLQNDIHDKTMLCSYSHLFVLRISGIHREIDEN